MLQRSPRLTDKDPNHLKVTVEELCEHAPEHAVERFVAHPRRRVARWIANSVSIGSDQAPQASRGRLTRFVAPPAAKVVQTA